MIRISGTFLILCPLLSHHEALLNWVQTELILKPFALLMLDQDEN